MCYNGPDTLPHKRLLNVHLTLAHTLQLKVWRDVAEIVYTGDTTIEPVLVSLLLCSDTAARQSGSRSQV